MEPFATVEQYEQRYGEVDEGSKDLLAEVLMDTTRLIAAELTRANIPINDEEAADLRMQVCRDAAHRAMAQESDTSVPIGVTQFSQSVGPYTESFSIRNYREVYLTKGERRMLGLGRMRIGSIAPKGVYCDSE